MNVFEIIRGLNFSAANYIVVGGAVMAALGIKGIRDIDIVVTPELFESCKQDGWQFHATPNGKPALSRGIVELYLDVNCGNFNPDFEELRSRATVIDGIPFCSLDDLIRFKTEYGRQKDLQDLKRIEGYLKSQ